MPHVDNPRFAYGKSTYVDVLTKVLLNMPDSAFAHKTQIIAKACTLVHLLIFLFMCIPEDILTYQPMTCHSIRTSFLDYICVYSVMVFMRSYILD